MTTCRVGAGRRGIEPVDGGPIRAGDQVAAGVHGNLDAVMAELVFHVDQALPIGQEQAGEGVAETMEADASKAGQSSKHRLRIVLP